MIPDHPFRNIAAAYFAAQGTLALAWWAGLLLSPPFRVLFPPAEALMAFALPDFTLNAGGSLASAYGILEAEGMDAGRAAAPRLRGDVRRPVLPGLPRRSDRSHHWRVPAPL